MIQSISHYSIKVSFHMTKSARRYILIPCFFDHANHFICLYVPGTLSHYNHKSKPQALLPQKQHLSNPGFSICGGPDRGGVAFRSMFHETDPDTSLASPKRVLESLDFLDAKTGGVQGKQASKESSAD